MNILNINLSEFREQTFRFVETCNWSQIFPSFILSDFMKPFNGVWKNEPCRNRKASNIGKRCYNHCKRFQISNMKSKPHEDNNLPPILGFLLKIGPWSCSRDVYGSPVHGKYHSVAPSSFMAMTKMQNKLKAAFKRPQKDATKSSFKTPTFFQYIVYKAPKMNISVRVKWKPSVKQYMANVKFWQKWWSNGPNTSLTNQKFVDSTVKMKR